MPMVYDISRTPPASGRSDELHRQDPSVDSLNRLHEYNGCQNHGYPIISVEPKVQQQLTQQHMRVTQQQQLIARPGHDESLNEAQLQQLLITYIQSQDKPSLETGSKHIAVDIAPSFDGQDYYDTYDTFAINVNTFQGTKSTTSAGSLDGFGNDLDKSTRNTPINELMKTKQRPNGLPSVQDLQPSPNGETPLRPCTPPSQIRMGESG